MIWKLEINNSYNLKKENWTSTSVAGFSLEEAIRERFFKIKYRNVQVWNEKEKKWKKMETK